MPIFIFSTITLQIRLIPVQFSIVDKIAFLSLTSDILFVRFSTSTRHLCIGSLIQYYSVHSSTELTSKNKK